MRPQGPPPANTNIKHKGREQTHTFQQCGDALASRLDGRTPDVHGAPRLTHEESQGSRNKTPNLNNNIPANPRERKGGSSSLHPRGRTVWPRSMLGSQGNMQARLPPTTPESINLIHPGKAAHDPEGALVSESGPIPAAEIVDSGHQCVSVTPSTACRSRLKELHEDPSSGTPICRAVKIQHTVGRTTEDMTWPAPSEEPVITTIIRDDEYTAKRAMQCWVREEEVNGWAGVCMELPDGSPSDNG